VGGAFFVFSARKVLDKAFGAIQVMKVCANRSKFDPAASAPALVGFQHGSRTLSTRSGARGAMAFSAGMGLKMGWRWHPTTPANIDARHDSQQGLAVHGTTYVS
jgi:hypothetical protein